MRKKILCNSCGNDYEPLYRINDGEVICQNCYPISTIKDFEVAERFLDPNQKRELNKFIQKIKNLSNPTEFFLSLLIYQNNIAEEFLSQGFYPLSMIINWIYSQYILEKIYTLKIKNFTWKNFNFRKEVNWENFNNRINSYMDLIENSLKFEHFERDFKKEKIIIGEQNGNIGIYITDKKDLFATPFNIAEILFRNNPNHYSNTILECKGYSPNILISNNPVYQEWSLSAKIFKKMYFR